MSMQLAATVGKKTYKVDVGRPHDLSIPVRFDGKGLSAFGAAPAHKAPYETQGFLGDVSKGGSCNCDMVSFSPHLHGTHTECVGHIAKTPMMVGDILKDSLIPATVITVTPEEARKNSDTYDPKRRPDDLLITKEMIFRALLGCDADFLEALVIRTLPNRPDKRTRNYATLRPPFFSLEAMHYLVSSGVKHLLADIPSIDRLDDEGKLANHHIFWEILHGRHAVDEKNPSPKTITELIYVDEAIPNGTYLLNLQVAPLASDAAPSRPLLYGIAA